MKERNKIIVAIVAVLLIIAIVGGATFAYWTWTTADNEETNVNFTITAPDMSATLTGDSPTFSGFIPVNPSTTCGDNTSTTDVDESTYVLKKTLTLTYTNNSTNAAIAKGTLTISNFTSPHGTPTTENLGHLNYALTTSSTSCQSNVITSGTFGATSGALFTDVTLVNNIAVGTTNATQNYYLWIWLDSGYNHQNVGSGVVSDPMQDISFTLTWSGTISNDV